MRYSLRAVVVAAVILIALAACSQGAPPAGPTTGPSATSAIEGATPVGTTAAHFNPTEAVGGGANVSGAVSDAAKVFSTVAQAGQLRISANASPPGATGAEVQSVSIIAQDAGGLLKGLDKSGKQSLGDALLSAAGEAWPNATISLLVSDPGGGGSIIGNRVKGGPNTVIAS